MLIFVALEAPVDHAKVCWEMMHLAEDASKCLILSEHHQKCVILSASLKVPRSS